MVDRPTLQRSLRGVNERPPQNRKRQSKKRGIPRIPRRIIYCRFIIDETRSRILYLARRLRKREFSRSVQNGWTPSSGDLNLEQKLARPWSPRLSHETRTMPIRMEGRVSQLVFRQKADNGNRLQKTSKERRPPYHEACGTLRIPYPEQLQTRRRRLRLLWWKWNDTYCLRTARSTVSRDGARPEILRCYQKEVVEIYA